MRSIFLLTIVLLLSTAHNALTQSCKGIPSFIAEQGFNTSKSAIVSSDASNQGVLLIQYKDPRQPQLGIEKQYIHPSWKNVGFAGSITRDRRGHTYVLSIPMVNTLLNPPSYWENLHRIDGQTGVMTTIVKLPVAGKPSQENLYGQMGMTYDCDQDQLFVSNISGSQRSIQKGVVTKIDLQSKLAENIITDLDVMGLGLWTNAGRKYLILGAARNSQIFQQELSVDNKVIGPLVPIISLDGVGPRGDDRARKIKMSTEGKMIVYGVPFYYNMTAPTFKRESTYTYHYDNQSSRWILESIQQ